MREALLSGRTILVPDNVTFAFNPMRVKIDDAAGVISISITDGVQTFTDAREPIGGKVAFELSVYARSFFDNTIHDVNAKELTCTITEGLNEYSFTTYVMWGAMNFYEQFNRQRKVTWFKNFPFKFNLYVPQGAIVRTRYDRNGYTSATLQEGLISINPNELFNPSEFGVIRMDNYIQPSVWEYTFDETFRGVDEGTHISRLVVDECTNGVYLRWVDRHGFVQYYLFKTGDDIYQTKAEGQEMNIDYETWYDFGNVQVQQRKIMTRSIKAGASLVDQETFDMLTSIYSSPLVELWYDNEWLPIRIADATINKTSKPLQDIEIEIQMPKMLTQSL